MNFKAIKSTQFTEKLLSWATQQNRQMPWKGEKNPYLIWLSEIILQQTRVEQGLPYYNRFKEKYPTIKDLADAPEDQVMKMWEGLGYYSRARNLHATAKMVAYEMNSKFPTTYKEILSLKGVGTYTAAAIASFAYNLPHAVVDGNVYRVLSRYVGIDIPIDTTNGKKVFSSLANELLDATQPGKYNQAIMDFGATYCTPKKPKCAICPMKKNCKALQFNKVELLPIKSKKIKKKSRFFVYLVLNHQDAAWIRKRTKKDIWRNLYEFPMIEFPSLPTKTVVEQSELWTNVVIPNQGRVTKISKPFRQTLSHQKITAFFWEITLKNNLLPTPNEYLMVERKNLSKFAFPKVFSWYFEDNSLTLALF